MKRSSKTAGTSFYNTILKATPQELIDALGKPHYFDNTGMSKTNMEYNLETSNGIHFMIGKNIDHYTWMKELNFILGVLVVHKLKKQSGKL